ncbi:hypothetical protein [Roseibium sp. RKSG952]|uniref:hypothetical protein n=1 Tax=Roseibium sp. RKSG952 TaxID=2529384 RepID=UPI0012BBC623|nr:hypothetical protein [Roseibium sp. RKSG952]MTH99180.1 hypothetical protein [Roseibium sp. RKSG952]
MCGYCGRPLNPGLIDSLRNDLPDNVVANGDTNNAGSTAMVNAVAVDASGGWQLQELGNLFKLAESVTATNAWTGNDEFVFNAPAQDTENGASANGLDLRLSSLMGQKSSSLSSQTTETPEVVFWTFDTVSSFDDWFS